MANTEPISLRDLASRFGDKYSLRFLAAAVGLLRDEGVHSRNPRDPGGDTWYGISRREYPHIAWPPDLDTAIGIYFEDWWLKFHIGELPDAVAAKVLDAAVNIGPREAVEALQRACRACHCVPPIKADGDLGPVTIGTVRTLAGRNLDALLAALRSECASHYRVLFEQHLATGEGAQSAGEFMEGWLNRAYE